MTDSVKVAGIAINRTDLPLDVRVAIIEAMNANGDFARADALDEERAHVLVRVAIAAEVALCETIQRHLTAKGTAKPDTETTHAR